MSKNMKDRLILSFFDRATWKLKFAWLPKRCVFSKEIIWFEQAYCGIAIWTGPGDDAVQIRWGKNVEYLIWRLKH